ncbi:MAG: GyrI-like domain-containing protein [Chloroflexota bacterium]
MLTLDLKKQTKALYSPSAKQPQIVEIPEMLFIRIDGVIEPGQAPGSSPGFQAAVEALYGISYTLKFMLKKRPLDPVDYPVMPLEGLWGLSHGDFDIRVKDNWRYTLQIMQPDLLTAGLFAEGLVQLRKKRGDVPELAQLRLERFYEGLAVQVLHLGPYAEEPATLERMHAFAAEQGCRLRYDHHEIYLGDPRRADPANMKTILRHPVEK